MELGQSAAAQVLPFLISMEGFEAGSSSAAMGAAAGHDSSAQQHMSSIVLDEVPLKEWVMTAAQQTGMQALPCVGGTAEDNAAVPVPRPASNAQPAEPTAAQAGQAPFACTELHPVPAPGGVKHSSPDARPGAASCGQAVPGNNGVGMAGPTAARYNGGSPRSTLISQVTMVGVCETGRLWVGSTAGC